MEFRAYASSSGGNLYTVTCGEAVLALECGLKIKDIREALKFGISSLAGALLTHSHMDHAQSVGHLLRAGVDVYASAGTWGALDALSREWPHRRHVLAPQKEVEVGPFRVLPWATRHDTEGSLGWLIGAPDGDRLLFAIDTAYVPYTFAGLTHVAIECNYSEALLRASDAPDVRKARTLRTHMGLERVIAMLAANDLRLVREIHLLHLSDQHGDGEAFCAAVRRATGKPAFAAPRDWRTP